MKIKLLWVVAAVLFISACAPTRNVLVETGGTLVIEPPSALYNCPQNVKIPDPATLTNREVAQVIDRLFRNNRTCGINMKKIQEFVAAAKLVQENA